MQESRTSFFRKPSMMISPVTITRVSHNVSNGNNDGVKELIDALLGDPDSIYILHPQIPTFLFLLNMSDKAYNAQLDKMLNEMKVEKIDNITEDYIVYLYDGMIAEMVSNEECSPELYHKVYEMIIRRNLLLWIITDNLQFIQLDIIGLLYSASPELLEYHSLFKIRHLLNMVCLKWMDVSMIYQWNHILQKCESIINEYEDEKLISVEEMNASYQLQWLLIYAMFLSGDYEDVINQFDKLCSMDTAVETLDLLDDSIIDKKCLFRVVVLSIILAEDNVKRMKYWNSEIFYDIFFEDPKIREFEKAYEDNEKIAIDCIVKDFKWCPLLDQCFERVEELLVQKRIVKILSIVHEIDMIELANITKISYDTLKEKVMEMISVMELPFKIDEDTIKYFPKNKFDEDIALMHHNLQQEVLRLKTVQLNKLINSNKDL